MNSSVIVENCIAEEWEALAEALRAEIQEYGALLQLLKEQQKLILDRDAKQLALLNKSIENQLTSNHQIRTARERFVVGLGRVVGMNSIISVNRLLPYFPGNAQILLKALMDEVIALFKRAQFKAKQNQLLVYKLAEMTQRLLDVITPGVSTKTYTRKGAKVIKSVGEGSWMKTSV